jgi:asparagine synthase (glutamine-hydrolysing)
MCGIVGCHDFSSIFEMAHLDTMVAHLSHRGPDSKGTYFDGERNIFLGHTRLSIVDLTKQGNQPFIRDDKVISFNGEIYNYVELRTELVGLGYEFFSNTDTEVIIVGYIHWGLGVFKKLNGMFALCIYDKAIGKLILARDRTGEKPLYYYHNEQVFCVASEIKALIWHPLFDKKISLPNLTEYLTLGYTSKNNTILRGFKKLVPGSIAIYDLSTRSFNSEVFWNTDQFGATRPSDNEQYLQNKLTDLLKKSVSKQLMGDVPVANLLSGGLDSSIITALTAQQHSTLSTFTITNPNNSSFDEASYAREIASYYGTDHTEIPITDLSGSEIKNILRHFDEPLGDSSCIPTAIISSIIGQDYKVALGGDGADELFGGYVTNNREYILQKYFSIFQNNFGHSAFKTFRKVLPERAFFDHLQAYLENKMPFYGQKFSKDEIKCLLSHLPSVGYPEQHERRRVPPINGLGHYEFNNYLANDILVKTDRSSMYHSLELRSPFLDADLIDFAFKELPDNLKANASERKILLKKVAKNILPNQFDWDRKKGFSIPSSVWLDAVGGYDAVIKVIKSSNIIKLPNDKRALDELLKTRSNTNEKIFLLYTFVLWEEAYGATL